MSLSSFFNFFRDYSDYAYHPDPSALDPDIRSRFLKGYKEEYLGLTKDTASFSKPLTQYFETTDKEFQKALARKTRDFTEDEEERLKIFQAKQALIKRKIELFEGEFEKIGSSVHPGDLAERARDEKKELLDELDELQSAQQTFLGALGVLKPKKSEDATAKITGKRTHDEEDKDEEDKEEEKTTISGGKDKKTADDGFEETSKKAREALEESLTDSIEALHDAAELEQNMRSLVLVMVANKRRFKYEQQSRLAGFTSLLSTPQFDGSLPDENTTARVTSARDLNVHDITFTGQEQTIVNQLLEAFRNKDADMINAINGGLAAMSGRSIKASSSAHGLSFGMNFPRWITNSNYYTSEQHNTQADLLCLATLVRETGAKTIEITLNHRDLTLGKQLAREAYAACQEAGFDPIDNSEEGKNKPQAITITLNGRPMSLEDLTSLSIGQPPGSRDPNSEQKISSNPGAARAADAKRKREAAKEPDDVEKQKKMKASLNTVRENDPIYQEQQRILDEGPPLVPPVR